MSSVARASKYSYRASSGGIADVNIEYSADLTALTRLEVKKSLIHIHDKSFVFKRSKREPKNERKNEMRKYCRYIDFDV